MNIALDALVEISHLLGAPLGAYASVDKVEIYELRVSRAFEIARRVLVVSSSAVPLPPSSLEGMSEGTDLFYSGS